MKPTKVTPTVAKVEKQLSSLACKPDPSQCPDTSGVFSRSPKPQDTIINMYNRTKKVQK